MVDERHLKRQFTGMVAASLVLDADVRAGRVRCGRCEDPGDHHVAESAPDQGTSDRARDGLAADDRQGGEQSRAAVLEAGDRVTATVTCYDNHSWELLTLRCADHGVSSVAESMGVSAEDQAVVSATLEPTGYRDPMGEYYPDALTLGDVEILDFSAAADGYVTGATGEDGS